MKKKLLITMGCSFTEGVGCYDPETIPIDMIDIMKDDRVEKVYTSNRDRFHKFSWPSFLQKQIKYDKLINLGLGGSSISGNVKIWFEKYYDKKLHDEYDVLIIWLLPEPSRFSFYANGVVKNINPSTPFNENNIETYNLGIEYVRFIHDVNVDPFLEEIFYIKVMEEYCKCNNYNLLYTPLDFNLNKLFEKFHNTEYRMIFDENIIPNFSENPEMKSLICGHPNEKGYEKISNNFFDSLCVHHPHLINTNDPKDYVTIWDGYPIFNHLDKLKSLI